MNASLRPFWSSRVSVRIMKSPWSSPPASGERYCQHREHIPISGLYSFSFSVASHTRQVTLGSSSLRVFPIVVVFMVPSLFVQPVNRAAGVEGSLQCSLDAPNAHFAKIKAVGVAVIEGVDGEVVRRNFLDDLIGCLFIDRLLRSFLLPNLVDLAGGLESHPLSVEPKAPGRQFFPGDPVEVDLAQGDCRE